MINEIKLERIATFLEPTVIKPLKINFCYGNNGSGKTTISNVILNGETVSPTPDPLQQTLVYNRNFINENFGKTAEIGGIFTLGKDSKEAQEFIKEQQIKADECDKQIKGFGRSKERLEEDQEERVSKFRNTCWKVMNKYDGDFGEAFKGLHRSKEKFSERCISESMKTAVSAPTFDKLKRQYGIAFGEVRHEYKEFPLIDATAVKGWEECDLLSQKISGSANTPIGKFIEYLGNSDWVRQGMPYIDKAEGKCPLCQQALPHDTYEGIKAFFDDSYERDLNQIKDFLEQYSRKTDELSRALRKYNEVLLSIPDLDYSLFKAELDALALKVAGNVQEIERKITSPSAEIKLEALQTSIDKINTELIKFNKAIAENNDFSRNQQKKQAECVKGVWQIVVSELKIAIDTFNKETTGNTVGIRNLDTKINDQTKQRDEYRRLIKEQESTLTSVKPTVDAINSILIRFGFEGFRLVENLDKVGTYKIVRPDGKNAKNTLSEGEYNFICFLYFYRLVYGSQEKTGTVRPKIVVIDDPISSLDSNVLFVVSTLVREIIDNCKNNRGGVKQVFILTHNVYFHKEITLLRFGKTWKKDETAFWTVKKNNNISYIIGHDNVNPIKSSYELLWSELKNPESAQRITIFNTLRRILEYYFNIIGDLNYQECIDKFDGEDKLVCKSLIACINDGSHFITDDFLMYYDSVEGLIRVFKLIFEKMGHLSHYNMMMGIEGPESINQ